MDLKEPLKKHIKSTGKSQNQIARSLGVSSSVISSWLSESYKGDNKKLAHMIGSYLRKEEKRARTLQVPTVAIETYRQMHFAMDVASEETDIALICGNAGVGKTVALLSYVKQKGGIYIKADKTYTQYQLTNALAEKLGVASKGSAAMLTERIIHTLEDLDTLVIIDEADYLTDGALEYLRQVVYDAGNTGLVLCGLSRLSAMIQNVRNDHDQLLSRVGVRLMLDDITVEDIRRIINAAWPGLKTPIQNALVHASRIRWRSEPSPCLRTLEKILKRLRDYTLREGDLEPSTEDVKNAARLVMRRY